MFQVKNFKATTKDIDLAQGIITAYWSSFDVVDSDLDYFDLSAFNKSIQERGPKGTNRIMKLWQHNPTMPLGKPMELYTDNVGLVAVTKISETSYGKDALKLYADGVLNEHSVGFQTIKSNYDESRKATRISEAKLWEGSAVTWGANEFTPVISGKSIDKAGLIEQYNVVCKAFYSGDYTDDTFKILEVQKKHFETIFTQSLETKEPLKDTPIVDQAEKLKQYFKQLQLETEIRRITNGRYYQST
jgi:HK97 family phage prohead protease